MILVCMHVCLSSLRDHLSHQGKCGRTDTESACIAAGEPEAVALDDNGKKVFDLHVIVVDDRPDDDTIERCA